MSLELPVVQSEETNVKQEDRQFGGSYACGAEDAQ